MLFAFDGFIDFSCLPVVFKAIIAFIASVDWTHGAEGVAIGAELGLCGGDINNLCMQWFFCPFSSHIHGSYIDFSLINFEDLLFHDMNYIESRSKRDISCFFVVNH